MPLQNTSEINNRITNNQNLMVMENEKQKQQNGQYSPNPPANQKITFATHSEEFIYEVKKFQEFIPLTFVPEKNRLKWWSGLKKFDLNKDVEVGMLVTRERLEELEKAVQVPQKVYYWVFDWYEFQTRCHDKKIDIKFDSKEALENSLANNDCIRRLEQLLGIDVAPTNPKVAICKLNVNTNYLFRPAYNPMIDSQGLVEQDERGKYSIKWPVEGTSLQNGNKQKMSVAQKDEIEDWLASLQQCKDYPWTRMGYTYDWGAKEETKQGEEPHYFGVSEFVIMPNSFYKFLETYRFPQTQSK